MIMSPDTDTIGYAAAALLDLLPADAAVGMLGAPVPTVRGGIVSRRALFEQLGRAGRVTQVSASAGSGKTFLLRSWIDAAGLAESTAWVSVQREERNPQRFWVSVLSALRQTAAGSTMVRPLTAAPDLDGWAVVERLLKDLESLQDQAWLVIDDVHELRSAEILRQLELLLMRAPPELRCVLATRHDMRLGLHRLRLEGELTEIRAANLRFTLDEAHVLFGAAGVELPESALTLLHARTEVTPHTLATPMRAHMLQALVLLGEMGRVERSLAELDPREREGGEMRNAIALLRLVQHDALGATAALAPVLDGSVRVHPVWVVAAALLEAIARDELGDPAAERAIERALDLAEPDLVLFPFLTYPVPALLERHARDCAKHAALVAEIQPASRGAWGNGIASGAGGFWRVVPPANRVVPPASRAAEPGRDPGAALSAD
jgi:hypothetical protein